MNAIVGRFTPVMIQNIGFGTYIVFGGCCALMFVWVWIFVPETKNRSLEEMDQVFGDETAAVDAERMGRIRSSITFAAVSGDVEAINSLPVVEEKAVHTVETAKTASSTDSTGSDVEVPK